jgi:sigma-B regulation protein RsbU (phosphoserine phosphatase)
MEINVFQRIQTGLIEKRRNLMDWLRQTPEPKKQVQLGPASEQAVQEQIATMNTALAKIEDNTLGICEVCHGMVETPLLEMDYTACICLGDLSEPEQRRLEAELQFIQVIQRGLLPQQVPEIPGMDLAVFSRPARIVSGDYFDFFRFRDGAHGLAIADAMGHGMAASLLMNTLQSALRTLAPEYDSPVDMLERVNRVFVHNSDFTAFVTTFLCRYTSTSRTLTFSNAGHNPPLLYCQQTGEISWLQPTGAAIGLAETFDIQARTQPCTPGDIILFYTDGVTEATNDREEAFGAERVATLVRQNAGLPAQSLLREIRQALNDFIGDHPLEDDITLVACKILE